MKKTYITRGVGYIALLAAIVEQANEDLETERKALEALRAKGRPDTELHGAAIQNIERGIREWADIAAMDTNFKVWE